MRFSILLGIVTSVLSYGAHAQEFDIGQQFEDLRNIQPDLSGSSFLQQQFDATTAITSAWNGAGNTELVEGLIARSSSIDPRIVGGTPTTIEENPWQVALIVGGTPDVVRQQFCGGSLISPTVVLTAAHCVDWLEDENGVEVLSGSTYYKHGGERLEVSEIHIHPAWIDATNSNDFAILKLATPSVSGTPIPFVQSDEFEIVDRTMVVSGWGALTQGGAGSEILMRAAVPYVSTEVCNQPQSYAGQIDETMFCAGHREGGVDACQGDSGGPIITSDGEGNSVLVGVVSWGSGCALRLKYGVYGRISFVHEWIESHT